MAGAHRSLRRGSSIEFSEHAIYSPGDDLRHIDWHAFAKTERLHVKRFEDETNVAVLLAVDHSNSMGFQSAELPSKLRVAKVLAAALAYLALRQGDTVGLAAFSDGVTMRLPARSASSHLFEILERLWSLEPHGETRVASTVESLVPALRRRHIVVLISDLFDPSPTLWSSLRLLVARHHELILLHVHDPAEVTFPYELPALFESVEDPRRVLVHPRALRHTYVTEFQKYLARTESQIAELRADYQHLTTDMPPGRALASLLHRRAHLRT